MVELDKLNEVYKLSLIHIYPEQATAKDLSVYEKQIQINKNLYH